MGVMDRTVRVGGRSVRSSWPEGLESLVALAMLLAAPACVENHDGTGEARGEALGTAIEPRAATPREPELGSSATECHARTVEPVIESPTRNRPLSMGR
jgi:hypothetical protein